VTSYVVAVLLAFLVVTLVTPGVRRLARATGVLDQPGGRHIHKVVTPRLGGVAIMLGFFTPLALFSVVRTGAMYSLLDRPDLVFGLVIGSLIVGFVGAVDDVRGLGPWVKLAAEALAAIVAYAFGYRIDAISLPLVGDLDMGAMGLPVTVFWFLAITNAINLIDGLDGLATGIALFATLCNLVVAFMNESTVVVLLSASLGGALLAFLRYNFNPASIFLGDSGSMFLGFTLAATSLAGATVKSSTAVGILVPILALGVPIVDTTLAMVRRTLARQSIFAADRGHIHHRLLDLGITHRRVVVMLYVLSVALAGSALAISFGRSWHIGLALVVVVALATGVVQMLVRSALAQPLLVSLKQEIVLAAESMAQAAGEAEVRRRLGELNVSTFQLVDAELLEAEELPPARNGAMQYELGAGGRARILRLSPRKALSIHPDAVEAELAMIGLACADALDRVVLREPDSNVGAPMLPTNVPRAET
jgi:UDP-GlcNAc:undecaprenyl-phosphate GlcNAc-1-phosphate transferase